MDELKDTCPACNHGIEVYHHYGMCDYRNQYSDRVSNLFCDCEQFAEDFYFWGRLPFVFSIYPIYEGF